MSETSPRGRFVWYDLMTTDPTGATDFYTKIAGWGTQAWENSPEAVQGSDPDATRERLVRRIAQIEEQLIACDAELAALRDTPLSRLRDMVDESAARGKDLIGDQVRRLKRDIVAARNRLDAMRL